MNRSYLFVPADSERKMKKAQQAGADALILDLEDSVAVDARPAARELAREYLKNKENVWVRINPIDTDDARADLDAIMPSAPAGIVLISTDLDEILDLADRIMVLVRGRLIPLPSGVRDRGEIGRVMLSNCFRG